MERFAERPAERFAVRGPGELVGGISGPSISLSAPDFGGSTYYEGVDDNDITVTINNATDGASWDLTISSSGGGTPVTASGTVSGSTVNAGAQNLTGLNAGILTFSYEEGSVEVASRTRTLAVQAAPDAPVISITAGASGSAQQTITWAKPTENGSAITGYTLTVDDGSGFSALATPGAGDTSYVHTGLIIGKEYTYRLTATNGVDTSDPSNEPAETPAGTVHVFLLAGQSNMLGRPTYDTLGDYGSNVYDWTGSDYQLASSPLTGADAGDMGLTITFTDDYLAANTEVDAVALVQMAVGGTGFTNNNWNNGDTEYEAAITEINQALANYATHTFQGILWNQGENDSNTTPTDAYQTALETMIGDMRSEITGASATTPFILGEIAESNADDIAINNYINDIPNEVAYTAVAQNTSLTTFDGLHWDAASLRTYGERYEDAYNSALLNVPAAPDQVGTVTPTAGDGQVALAWDDPSSNGSPITDYVVEYKLSSSGTWLTFADGTSATTGATVTGLTNDSAYDFRVSAVNAIDTGTASATVSETPAEASGLSIAAFDSDEDFADRTTYTFSSLTISGNTAIVGIYQRGTGQTISSVTVGGQTATLIGSEYSNTTNANSKMSFWHVNGLTGSTADVVATFSASTGRASVAIWSVPDAALAKCTLESASNTATAGIADTIAVKNGGVLLAHWSGNDVNTATIGWADDVTQRLAATQIETVIEHGAADAEISADATATVTVTQSASVNINTLMTLAIDP